jgi:ABC-type microcin C transport system duplicated ATPase subunit YejF
MLCLINTFVIAFHSLLFLRQNAFATEDCTTIRNALTIWKSVWEMYTDQLSCSPPHAMVRKENCSPGINMWKRIGFMRHSPEFWLLATVVVDRISSTSDMRWGMGTAIVGDSGSGSGTSAEPILAVIDQTSMRQVNDLITEFQNVQLH